ncbi:MAG: EAL domain-containing protein, partial [Actinobacteria bacterium]|nr:EAL domain-containing protein [Actinomycetota bacterium]
PRNAVDQHVVKAMVQVARGMEKRTVAEFVSDEETVQLLREYGVDYAQGYHIGRPRAMCGEVPNVIATTEREG